MHFPKFIPHRAKRREGAKRLCLCFSVFPFVFLVFVTISPFRVFGFSSVTFTRNSNQRFMLTIQYPGTFVPLLLLLLLLVLFFLIIHLNAGIIINMRCQRMKTNCNNCHWVIHITSTNRIPIICVTYIWSAAFCSAINDSGGIIQMDFW